MHALSSCAAWVSTLEIDDAVADALGISEPSMERLKQRFVEKGKKGI
jgi:hypothetical protein